MRASSQRLSSYCNRNRPISIRLVDAEQEQLLELPAGAVALLMEILEAMADGRSVSILPENADVTTVQAAEILNVSRPFLSRLLAEGALRYRDVGKHRQILLEDVMSYKDRIDRDREAVLDQLAADAQENGLGYPGR